MKTERHDCSFCDKQLYRQFLGAHYVKFHLPELKKNLSRYLKTPTPHFPLSLSVNNKYVCMCCYDVQTQKARAEKHAENNPECSYEKQLQALWLLLEIEPPEKPKIVVTSSHSREKTQLAEAKESETEYFNKYSKCILTIENLQAQNKLLQEQVQKLREDSTDALKAKMKLDETRHHHEKSILEDKIQMLLEFLPKESKSRYERIGKDAVQEEKNEIKKLEKICTGFTVPVKPKVVKPIRELTTKPKFDKCSFCESCNKNVDEADDGGYLLRVCMNCSKETCKDCRTFKKGEKAYCSRNCKDEANA
jgi:hypothetical protein